MELNGFERAMIAVLVGNTPQRRPADMRMAVAVLDRLQMTEDLIARLDGVSLARLVISEEHEGISLDLSPDEAKFVVRVMITNGNFGGRMLRLLIPLWERLYPNWEELAPEPSGERRHPDRRTPG